MVVTNEFRPDPRVLKEAKSLTQKGYAVAILGWDRSKSGLPRQERIDGIEVHRVSVPGGRYGAGFLQLLGYAFFYIYLLGYLIRRRREIDILHAHEVDILPVCSLVRALYGFPMIADFHELYSGRDEGLMPKLMGVVERTFLKYVDVFVTVNDDIAAHYRPLLPLGAQVAVVPNYPERQHLSDVSGNRDSFTVSFFGNVRNAREIITLVEAARRVPGTCVLVAGHGHQAAQVAAYVADQPHARYLGPFSYDQQAALYRQSSVVYAVCALDRNMANAYPVKMWEGLICGQPVIVGKGSVAEQFLLANNAGDGATGADVDELAAVIERIRRDYTCISDNARTLGAKHNWEFAVEHLFQVYETISSGSSTQ